MKKMLLVCLMLFACSPILAEKGGVYDWIHLDGIDNLDLIEHEQVNFALDGKGYRNGRHEDVRIDGVYNHQNFTLNLDGFVMVKSLRIDTDTLEVLQTVFESCCAR